MPTVWTRLNTGLLILVLLGIIAVLAMRVEGGPLDPPGAPAPTDSVRYPARRSPDQRRSRSPDTTTSSDVSLK